LVVSTDSYYDTMNIKLLEMLHRILLHDNVTEIYIERETAEDYKQNALPSQN
jgi:hypothetical protein